MEANVLRPTDYYRLPWSLTDNVLAWLEPTKRCNLYCEGCYSRNDPKSDKPLEQVRAEIASFLAQRKVDSLSIAGGDPLVYPHIVEVVRMIRHDFGVKPIINTNGLALTDELLAELRDAGLFGFTFHIDSSQGRPGWKKKNELELNALREHYAKRVHAAGDLSVSFNMTVFPETLHYVPELLDWAASNIDIVHGMVFILFRTMRSAEFDYFAQGDPVEGDNLGDLVYYDQDKNPEPLKAQDVVDVIRAADPSYSPAAYLGGTKDPNSFKWLLAGRLGAQGRIHGYVGPRYMEMIQTAHHAVTGKWLGYVQPSMLSHGRSMLSGFAPFDTGVRKIAANWAKDTARAPWRAAEKLHFQSVLIIQPIDMMPDGEMNMCDGCPDMTVKDGQLLWSCRLDEYTQHGCFLTASPRKAPIPEAK